MSAVATVTEATCRHCGTEYPVPADPAADTGFCCAGCRFVFGLINEEGLDRFYDLKGGSTLQPVSASGQFLRYPQPKVVDPVTLTGSDGADFPLTQLKGRWTLAFFGFTHCPDACPTALAMLKSAANVWSRLPIERQPQILFVSVDPERDTPEVLDRYVHFFNPDFIAATADHSILLPWTRSLGVVYDQVPEADGGGSYTVDHSTSILVFNPELQMIGMLRPPHTAAQIVEDLAPVLESVQP